MKHYEDNYRCQTAQECSQPVPVIELTITASAQQLAGQLQYVKEQANSIKHKLAPVNDGCSEKTFPISIDTVQEALKECHRILDEVTEILSVSAVTLGV